MLYSAKAAFTNTPQTDPYRGAGAARGVVPYRAHRRVCGAQARPRPHGASGARSVIPRAALPWKTPMGLSINSRQFRRAVRSRPEPRRLREFPAARCGGQSARHAAGDRRGSLPGMHRRRAQGRGESGVWGGWLRYALPSAATPPAWATRRRCRSVLAAKLGLPIESIRFLQADTAITKTGGGHGGSRGLEVGGNAVAKAADEIDRQGAHDCGAPPVQLATRRHRARPRPLQRHQNRAVAEHRRGRWRRQQMQAACRPECRRARSIRSHLREAIWHRLSWQAVRPDRGRGEGVWGVDTSPKASPAGHGNVRLLLRARPPRPRTGRWIFAAPQVPAVMRKARGLERKFDNRGNSGPRSR